MTNDEIMTKLEIRRTRLKPSDQLGSPREAPLFLRLSSFVIRASFVIRHSGFVIRHSDFVIRHSVFLGLVLSAILFPLRTHAHIGSPNVFYEGYAGPYPVRVTVRPPPVIPGRAEISVRVMSAAVKKVAALPVVWNAGRKGAPPPDEARLVRGETNLYSTELWFMVPAAHSVYVDLDGDLGSGTAIVPVNAIATRRLGVPRGLGVALTLLGAFLVLLLLTIVRAAARESVLPPGESPSLAQGRRANLIAAIGGMLLLLLFWGGKKWWDKEDANFRNNRLYKPALMKAELREQRLLRLTREDLRTSFPIVPDHGKLMHLFLVREPQLDAFAHLHPVKLSKGTFEVPLPPLPAGKYSAYADITYENGYADTLTAEVELPETTTISAIAERPPASDPDDSWHIGPALGSAAGSTEGERTVPLADGYTITWLREPGSDCKAAADLRFVVRDASGQPAKLEPYMGMLAHAAVRRADGAVFAHIHPAGTISMASQQLFALRAEGKAPLAISMLADEPICKLPSVEESQAVWLRQTGATGQSTVSFPYEFPRPGTYRLWVQVKVNGQVLTGAFDTLIKRTS